MLLASSLHDVHFRPGQPFSSGEYLESPDFLPGLSNQIVEIPLWKALLFWVIICVDILLFLYLLPADVRKRLLRQAIRFAITILVLFLAFRYHLIKLPPLSLDAPARASGTGTSSNSLPVLPTYQPPEIAPWVIYLISMGTLVVILMLLWLGYRWWERSRRRSMTTLSAIAGVARSSMADLMAGREWTDVIIRSYVRMGEVVNTRRGVRRAPATTPREFARRLEDAGLPADAVRRLTGLFESARYGVDRSSQSDVDEALACLGSILRACGEIA